MGVSFRMSARETARRLRRRATPAEQLLWRHVRSRQLAGLKIRRQAPIGPFIVDFLCDQARLIIELDGGQHARENARDAARSSRLMALGYRVIRFWNNEVLENTEAVLTQIAQHALTNPPSPDGAHAPPPSPEGRGK